MISLPEGGGKKPKRKAELVLGAPAKIDTSNQYLVGAAGEAFCIVNPPLPRQVISKEQAINLAAWLMVIADPTGKEFERVVEAIVKT